MSNVENQVLNDILTLIKHNLQLLIYNKDSCLYHLITHCDQLEECDLPLDQVLLTKFTEDALYALLNADFLYDFRDIE